MSDKLRANTTTSGNQGGEVTGSSLPGGKFGLDARTFSGGISAYITHEIDETSNSVSIFGKINCEGKWLIQRMTHSGGLTTIDFSNKSNNESHDTLAGAWPNRASLSYSTIDALTGI